MYYWYEDNPNCGRCGHLNGQGFCNMTACLYPVIREGSTFVVNPITNADRIRAMTDEELADFLDKTDPVFWKRETWLDWLRQEAEEG